MNPEFKDYLQSMGLTEPLLARAEAAYQFYVGIGNTEIKDIFVSEFVDSENRREYTSLWFFSDAAVMECHDFVSAEVFDSVATINGVNRWVVSKENYDFSHADESSRIVVDISFGIGLAAQLKASGSNCDHLKRVFLAHILRLC